MSRDDSERDGAAIERIRTLISAASGIDFGHYKGATIERRTRRRMDRLRIAGLAEYARRLAADPVERRALVDDVLILTTGFFRDPAVFDALCAEAFPRLFARARASGRPIRAWSAGCSTGEEAYSIAIALLEYERRQTVRTPVVVFATDVSEPALRVARQGIYPGRISAAVSPERLRSFFTGCDGGYRVSKEVRDLCTFARHDVTRDPPFPHLDLILCRNVLIYMEPVLQREVLGRLHWALDPGGFLVLGTAEAIVRQPELFAIEDRVHRIYVKDMEHRMVAPPWGAGAEASRRHLGPPADRHATEVVELAGRIVQRRRAGAAVLVGPGLDVIRFYGRTGRYLAPSPGTPTWNLVAMLREGVRGVRAAVDRARRTGEPVRCGGSAGGRDVRIDVLPLTADGKPYLVVVFDEGRARGDRSRKRAIPTRPLEGDRTAS